MPQSVPMDTLSGNATPMQLLDDLVDSFDDGNCSHAQSLLAGDWRTSDGQGGVLIINSTNIFGPPNMYSLAHKMPALYSDVFLSNHAASARVVSLTFLTGKDEVCNVVFPEVVSGSVDVAAGHVLEVWETFSGSAYMRLASFCGLGESMASNVPSASGPQSTGDVLADLAVQFEDILSTGQCDKLLSITTTSCTLQYNNMTVPIKDFVETCKQPGLSYGGVVTSNFQADGRVHLAVTFSSSVFDTTTKAPCGVMQEKGEVFEFDSVDDTPLISKITVVYDADKYASLLLNECHYKV